MFAICYNYIVLVPGNKNEVIKMDAKDIKDIVELVGKMGISHLELEKGDTRLIVKGFGGTKDTSVSDISLTQKENLRNQPQHPVEASIDESLYVIKSPMVGTFYSAPSPDSKPFIETGSMVKKGDTLCIIEAMKVMNDIVSEFQGQIVDIFVNNGDIVEYGQELISIRK